jgi:hypothetical protein
VDRLRLRVGGPAREVAATRHRVVGRQASVEYLVLGREPMPVTLPADEAMVLEVFRATGLSREEAVRALVQASAARGPTAPRDHPGRAGRDGAPTTAGVRAATRARPGTEPVVGYPSIRIKIANAPRSKHRRHGSKGNRRTRLRVDQVTWIVTASPEAVRYTMCQDRKIGRAADRTRAESGMAKPVLGGMGSNRGDRGIYTIDKRPQCPTPPIFTDCE